MQTLPSDTSDPVVVQALGTLFGSALNELAHDLPPRPTEPWVLDLSEADDADTDALAAIMRLAATLHLRGSGLTVLLGPRTPEPIRRLNLTQCLPLATVVESPAPG